jgi:predicted PurR-regulated permease PerM
VNLKSGLNIWRILGVLALLVMSVIFLKVLIYVVISMVLFLIFYPLTRRIEKIKIGKYRIPDAFSALITIGVIIGLLSGLFYIVLPPLVTEAKFLSALNFYDVLHNLLNQFPLVKEGLLKLGTEQDLQGEIAEEFNKIADPKNLGGVVNNIFDYFGTVVGGTLCVLFITFFFLKDEMIVKQTLLTLTPSGKEKEMRDILNTSKRMLSKYFAALFLDMFIVGILVLVALTIMGIKNALLIAFIAGLLNVIPYIGSVITMLIAIFLGVSGCINSGNYELIGPVINKIFFSLFSINLIDGFLIQPFIFSNSVKAHPLEIFIVTLMAAILGGIVGMIIALPVYTLIRIIAKEFLTHLKFFRKLSETIED